MIKKEFTDKINEALKVFNSCKKIIDKHCVKREDFQDAPLHLELSEIINKVRQLSTLFSAEVTYERGCWDIVKEDEIYYFKNSYEKVKIDENDLLDRGYKIKDTFTSTIELMGGISLDNPNKEVLRVRAFALISLLKTKKGFYLNVLGQYTSYFSDLDGKPFQDLVNKLIIQSS